MRSCLQRAQRQDIEYVGGDALSKTIKPNFRVLGKKVGKQMKAVAAIVNALDAEAIQTLESEGEYDITVEDAPFTLTLEDVEISAQDIPGWSIASDGALTVALDLTLTPALEREGLARELVNRIQNLRKGSGLEVTDRITVTLSENDTLQEALDEHGAYVMSEVLADGITFGQASAGSDEDFGEVGVVRVAVEKA